MSRSPSEAPFLGTRRLRSGHKPEWMSALLFATTDLNIPIVRNINAK